MGKRLWISVLFRFDACRLRDGLCGGDVCLTTRALRLLGVSGEVVFVAAGTFFGREGMAGLMQMDPKEVFVCFFILCLLEVVYGHGCFFISMDGVCFMRFIMLYYNGLMSMHFISHYFYIYIT